jgi:hypothetical protein
MSLLPAVPLSRRRFLAGGGAMAGAVLLGACGDDDGASSTTSAAGTDLALVQFFGGEPMLAAGSEVRAPFGVADAQGLLDVDDTPESLTVAVLDASGGEVVAPIRLARHAEGLPRGYFPLRFTVDEPGIYTGRTEVEGQTLEMAIKVDSKESVGVIQPGEPLPAIDTPTTGDPHGVDPICTDDPVCPLHDVTVTEALGEGRPLALLVSTPAFCQIAVCGPVLDVLLGVMGDFDDVRFLHAEVYAHPREDTDTKAPVIDALGLTFEPCLVLVGADGKVTERLDTIFDTAEATEALSRLA